MGSVDTKGAAWATLACVSLSLASPLVAAPVRTRVGVAILAVLLSLFAPGLPAQQASQIVPPDRIPVTCALACPTRHSGRLALPPIRVQAASKGWLGTGSLRRVAHPIRPEDRSLLWEQEPQSPRSGSVSDYLEGIAVGTGLGVLTGGGLGFLGSRLGDTGAQENPVGTVSAIVLGAVGYTVGSALGVHAFESRRHESDSSKSTFVGAVVGLLAGAAIGFAQPGDNLNGIFLGVALTAPPIGAVIGFFR